VRWRPARHARPSSAICCGTGSTAGFGGIATHGDYARHKPHPDPFLKAAEILGVEPRACLAIEDSHHGVRSASSAGMMTVMVPDLLPAIDEICALCLHVVPDLHAVHRTISSCRPG